MLTRLTDCATAGGAAAKEYAYGFECSPSGKYSYGHGGIAPGVNAEFRHFPDVNITLVLLCNQDNAAFDDLKRHTISLIERAQK
jgi:hypothetical protein